MQIIKWKEVIDLKKIFCFLLKMVFQMIIRFAIKQLFAKHHLIIATNAVATTGVILISIVIIRY